MVAHFYKLIEHIMANDNLGPTQKSQHLGYGYKPRSKLDLFNPGQDKQANEEVVAFLHWLDGQEHSRGFSDQRGNTSNA
jgi:hypothetical protein